MSSMYRFLGTIAVILSVAGSSRVAGSPYIHNKFIAIPCCGEGALPFREIETIHTLDELNNYFSFLKCDASELTTVPDFTTEVAFGIVTGYCQDHHTIESRSPEGVTLSGDTFTIIIHSNTQIDSTRELPLAFCTMLITLNKSYLTSEMPVPPVVMYDKERQITGVNMTAPKALSPRVAEHRLSIRRFDAAGRSLSTAPQRTSGITILTDDRSRGVKRIVTGGSIYRK